LFLVSPGFSGGFFYKRAGITILNIIALRAPTATNLLSGCVSEMSFEGLIIIFSDEFLIPFNITAFKLAKDIGTLQTR
jgi:hypothetical protein